MPNPLVSFPNTPWSVTGRSLETPCKEALAIIPQLRPRRSRTSRELRRFLGWTTALSSVPLVAIFLTASANLARAGECVETDPANSPGVYECSGALDAANDVTQDLSRATIDISVADGFGIDTTNQGGNALTITSDSGLTFLDSDSGSTITGAALGIVANSTGAGTISITTNGSITAHWAGIKAEGFGDGDISITSSGDVMSTNGKAIIAQLGSEATAGLHSGNITINTNNVDAKNHGIEAINYYSGDISISSSGIIKSQDETGIFARLGNAATSELQTGNITINTNNVDAMNNGIDVLNYYSGDISITSTGKVESQNKSGVLAHLGTEDTAGTQTGDMIINVNDVEGKHHGIDAENYFEGTVRATVSGTVTADTESGIFVESRAAGDVFVTMNATSTINAHHNGIVAKNHVDGDIDLDVHGTITTAQSIGVDAEIWDGNIDIEVTGDVTAGSWGVNGVVHNTEKDDDHTVKIRTSGTITGGLYKTQYDAIAGRTHAGGNVEITTTGDLFGRYAGIWARVGVSHEGNGDIDIVATGQVNGTDQYGIYAWIRNNGNITIETGEEEVSGGRRGIHAAVGAGDYGTGDINITVNGDVTGGSQYGVNFVNGDTNTLNTNNDITISGGTHDVFGGTGNETINNNGILTTAGVIDLGEGVNAFNNLAGATHNSGSRIGLGKGNWYTNHGDLSPGGDGAIQKTYIDGNFRNMGTGKLLVQINSTGIDTLFVSGSADLKGGTVVATFENEQDASLFKRHLILITQGGLGGTSFDDLDSNLDDYELVHYQDRSAFVMNDSTEVTFCDFANTQNQRSTACTGLDSLPLDDELVLIFEAFNEGDDDLVRAAYDALSGELHASMKGALAVSLQQQGATVFSRMRDLLSTSSFQSSTTVTAGLAIGTGDKDSEDGEGGEGGGESAAIPSGFWASGYGGWSDVDATGNTAQMDDEYSGFLVGIDGDLLDTLKLGFVGGRSINAVAQDARNSDGDIETFTAGFYGGTEFGNTRLRFAGLFSQHTLETSRRVEILDLYETALAEYDATSWQVSAETGYHMETGSMEWEPFARLSHIGMDIDGYSEESSGLGLTALTAPSEEHSTTFGVVGVRTSIGVADWINVHGMVGWRGAWGDTDPTSTFTINGSAPFIVAGAPISENAFVGELGAVAQLSSQAAMHVSYTGLQSSEGSDHGIRAKLMMRF